MDRDTHRALVQQQASIDKLFKAMGQEAAKRQREQQDAGARKVVELLTEIQGRLIDKSAAYTNLIMIGGYASLFTIWSATRASLPVKANVSVALAISFSIAVFIAFEIYKMIFTGTRFLKNRRYLTEPAASEVVVQRLEELKRNDGKLPVAYLPIWIAVLVLSILGAVIALAILGYNFIAILVGWPQWPS